MRKVYILKFVLALLLIVTCSNLAFSEEKPVNTIEQFVELDKKIQSLSDSIKNKENSNNIELAKNQLELANKIIDWSAMFFAALAALIVIAGAVGLKEFSKIKRTEKNMREMLSEVKSELESIQNYKSDIVTQTRQFMEVSYYYNQGVTQYHSEKYMNARELFYKLLAIDNNNMKAYLYIGKSLMMEGDRNSADEVYSKMKAIDANSSYPYVGIALNCFKHDKEKALKNCDKGYELAPDNSGNLETLAYIYRNIDEIEKSFNCAMRSHTISATASNSFFIALLYYSKGDKQNAFKYLDECKYLATKEIEKARKVHWGYFKIAVVNAFNNNMKKAETNIYNALKHNSSHAIIEMMQSDLNFITKIKSNKNISKLSVVLDEQKTKTEYKS